MPFKIDQVQGSTNGQKDAGFVQEPNPVVVKHKPVELGSDTDKLALGKRDDQRRESPPDRCDEYGPAQRTKILNDVECVVAKHVELIV